MFTPREQRVLSLVLSTPERSFNLAELMSRSGAGSGAGQHAVRRLWEAGVLRESRVGNQRLFQANTDFPLYPELRSICAKSFGLAGMLREALAPLMEEIDEAFVFGSVARGTDTAGTDIDLMVVGRVSLTRLLDQLAPLDATLGRPVHVNLHHPAEWTVLCSEDSVVRAIVDSPTIRIVPDETPRSGG
ncbi:MAG TPA: nucleotidyltransferase domain-containing protein [Paraburkholderia sp.]